MCSAVDHQSPFLHSFHITSKNRQTEKNPPWKKTHQNGPPTRKWSPCHGRDASGWWSVGIDAVELWLRHLWQPCVRSSFSSFIPPLVGGFNPFEKYARQNGNLRVNIKNLWVATTYTTIETNTFCSKKKVMFYQHPPTGWCFLHLPNGIAALMAHPVALRENSQACRLKMSFIELQHILPDLPQRNIIEMRPPKLLSGKLSWGSLLGKKNSFGKFGMAWIWNSLQKWVTCFYQGCEFFCSRVCLLSEKHFRCHFFYGWGRVWYPMWKWRFRVCCYAPDARWMFPTLGGPPKSSIKQ